MNILHISTDDISGGAGIAAYRLNEAMIQNGINSKLLVINKRSHSNAVVAAYSPIQKIAYSLYSAIYRKLIFKLFKPLYVFSIGKTFSSIHNIPKIKEADIIYIHWVENNFIGIKEIQKILKSKKPVIMYMHDMWDITGGCHHSFQCQSYTQECKDCPIIQRKIFKNYTHKILKKKIRLWTPYTNLYFITPSSWLADCTRKSSICTNHSVTVIANLINTQIFKPIDKQFARNTLGLPLNKKLILFGANQGTSNSYKGWNLLKEALYKLKGEDVELVIFGDNLSDNEIQSIPFPIHSLGYITDSYSLALMYNAADVFVNPSLAESFGMTSLESISCGTFSVSFAVGGLTDIIKHKETGYLAEYKNIDDLVQGVKWSLNQTNTEKRSFLHQYVVSHFSYKEIINAHQKFYTQFLSQINR